MPNSQVKEDKIVTFHLFNWLTLQLNYADMFLHTMSLHQSFSAFSSFSPHVTMCFFTPEKAGLGNDTMYHVILVVFQL